MILDDGRGETPGHKVLDGLFKNRINLFICRIITTSECKKAHRDFTGEVVRDNSKTGGRECLTKWNSLPGVAVKKTI